MKRARINVGKIGVVTKKGDYKKLLTAGSHWIGINENVTPYNMSKLYTSDSDLNIMLKDEEFKNLVDVLEVRDNEIAIHYEGGNFKGVLTSGRYFSWKGLIDFKFIKSDLSKVEITEQIDLAVLKHVNVEKYIRSFTVQSHEEGLLFVNEKWVRKLGKGTYYFWENAIAVEVKKVDVRQLQMEMDSIAVNYPQLF